MAVLLDSFVSSLWHRQGTGRGADGPAPFGTAGVLPLHASWSGMVRLEGDVVVPRGGHLEVRPGTRIVAVSKPSWKYRFDRSGDRGQRFGADPNRSALVVLGSLTVLGTERKPIRFSGSRWSGIFLLDRSRAVLENVDIVQAAWAGVGCYDRSCLNMKQGRISECGGGLIAAGLSRADVSGVVFTSNRWGVLSYDFAELAGSQNQFLKNQWGMRSDDKSRTRLQRSGFRANNEAGWLIQGRARVSGDTNVFEGHPNIAVMMLEKSSTRFQNSRLFQNKYGYQTHQEAALVSVEDKIGPSELVGCHLLSNESAVFQKGFFHSHRREPALQSQGRGPVLLENCQFFGNDTAASFHGRSRALVKQCEFRGHHAAAVRMGELAKVTVQDSRFRHNRTGAVAFGRARGVFERNLFIDQKSAAVEAYGDAVLDLRGSRFEQNGSGVEAHDGVLCSMRDNVVVRQRGHGVLMRHHARFEGRRNHFEANGIAAVQGMGESDAVLSRNVFQSNGVGVGLGEKAMARVIQNTFHGNRREGASCSSETGGLLHGNVFVKNNVGVGHFGGDRSVVRRNRFWENEISAGLCADQAAPRWEKNHCVDNPRGLDCRDGSRPDVFGNRFERCRETALSCQDHAVARVERNLFLKNKIAWQAAVGVLPDLSSNRFEQNTMEIANS